MTEPAWEWWIGPYEERYSEAFATREGAIKAGRFEYCGDGFHIVEAYQNPVLLSQMFDADGVLDRLERFDECHEEMHDPEDWQPVIDLSEEQVKSLAQALQAAADEWQRRNGLTFTPFAFTGTRNQEFIPPEDEPTD